MKQPRQPGLQDRFLNAVRRSKAPVTIFLVKGVKLQGVITWFDAFSILLRRDGTAQLVYKHAISTIHPQSLDGEITASAPTEPAADGLQDNFLAAAAFCAKKSVLMMMLLTRALLAHSAEC